MTSSHPDDCNFTGYVWSRFIQRSVSRLRLQTGGATNNWGFLLPLNLIGSAHERINVHHPQKALAIKVDSITSKPRKRAKKKIPKGPNEATCLRHTIQKAYQSVSEREWVLVESNAFKGSGVRVFHEIRDSALPRW